MKPLTVYLGWDSRETRAYAVAEHSLRRRSSVPLDVVPLVLNYPPVSQFLKRPIKVEVVRVGGKEMWDYGAWWDSPGNKQGDRLWCPISEAPMSTEFALSRFVVPFVQREGWALFADCDILCLGDVAELFALADDRYAVMCVKHEQRTGETMKMGGEAQTYYDRKNWSSVVLWNGSHPAHANLSTTVLNQWTGRALHAFRWLRDDEIGELPVRWNYLVGVNEPADLYDDGPCGLEDDLCHEDPDAWDQDQLDKAGILHYTLGGPWITGWQGGPLDGLWNDELKHLEGEEDDQCREASQVWPQEGEARAEAQGHSGEG